MKKILIIAVIAVVGFAVIGKILMDKQISVPNQEQTPGETERYMDIETFVKTNISNLSPEKEVLGGKFYVTKIETHGGTGTVEYEDGHIAFTADFTYSVDANGKPTVDTFKIRN